MVVPNLRAITTTALVVRISTGPTSHFLPRKCEVSNWLVESGIQQPELPENYYGGNDEELMDADDYPQQTQAPAPAQPRREREGGTRERHDESSKRRHHRS